MRYKDRDELVRNLREFADFIEEKGLELPIQDPMVTSPIWLWDDSDYSDKQRKRTARQKMRAAAKGVGQAQKEWHDGSLDLTRKFGKFVELQFTISRNRVCERKVIGVKEIPEQVIPPRTEEIVEWICLDPILSDAS